MGRKKMKLKCSKSDCFAYTEGGACSALTVIPEKCAFYKPDPTGLIRSRIEHDVVNYKYYGKKLEEYYAEKF